jgi:DNA-binding response OmpR family regulator
MIVATHGAVLILEDDYFLATALAGFVADAGFSVVGPFASMDTAQVMANDQGIDAALLDIRLGGDARSFDFASRLQALRIPFAFVTAYSQSLLPLALQQTPFLIKPPTREDVAKILQLLLPPSSTRPVAR